jgi:uncharacterized membrane protein
MDVRAVGLPGLDHDRKSRFRQGEKSDQTQMRAPRTIEGRLLWTYFGYVLLSVFVYVVSDRFEHFFFAINLTLAMVPLWLAKQLLKDIQKPWVWWAIALAVVAFFPNAFYLFTDFIHLGGTAFFGQEHLYAPLVYDRNWVDWLRVVHIGLGAVVGGVSGVAAYGKFRLALIRKTPRLVQWLPLMLVLSSVGIYIGRFLRFNSWDLLFRPFAVLSSVWSELDSFAAAFMLFFLVLQGALIWLLTPLFSIAVKEDPR